jgi:hypothetical protein
MVDTSSVLSVPEAEAPGLVFSAPFSPSGRLYEPEATSHFRKVYPLYTKKNGQVVQSSNRVLIFLTATHIINSNTLYPNIVVWNSCNK